MLVRTVLSPYELPDSSRSFLNLNEKLGKLGIRGARCAEPGPIKLALLLREAGEVGIFGGALGKCAALKGMAPN